MERATKADFMPTSESLYAQRKMQVRLGLRLPSGKTSARKLLAISSRHLPRGDNGQRLNTPARYGRQKARRKCFR